jgi:hypothetical protein
MVTLPLFAGVHLGCNVHSQVVALAIAIQTGTRTRIEAVAGAESTTIDGSLGSLLDSYAAETVVDGNDLDQD